MTAKLPKAALGPRSALALVPTVDPTPAQAGPSEAIVLAAVLLDASALADVEWLLPEHFFLKAHSYVWQAIQALAARHSGPLPAAPWAHDVAAELARSKRLQDAGGMHAVAALVDLVPEVLDLTAHAEAVYSAWHQREIANVAARLAADARHSNASPDELLAEAEQHLVTLQALGRRQSVEWTTIGEAAAGAMGAVTARARGEEGAVTRLPTGFAEIDRLSGGGPAREALWFIGGRPGKGKTALAMNIGMNLAFDGHAVAVFSLEMTRGELAERVLSSESGVSAGSRELSDDDLQALADAAARVQRLPLVVDDTKGLTIDELERRARRIARHFAARGKRLGAIIVDYVQILQIASVPGRNRREEIKEISRRLKVLAGELKVVVIAMAQLNRAHETEMRRPRESDLAECDQMGRDADWIGLLWRRRQTPEWETDLAICKQRTGAPEADIKLGWQGHITRFSDA